NCPYCLPNRILVDAPAGAGGCQANGLRRRGRVAGTRCGESAPTHVGDAVGTDIDGGVEFRPVWHESSSSFPALRRWSPVVRIDFLLVRNSIALGKLFFPEAHRQTVALLEGLCAVPAPAARRHLETPLRRSHQPRNPFTE